MAGGPIVGTYDADLQQYREASTVNPAMLIFMRWALAHGRLQYDGHAYHAYMTLEIEPCEGLPRCEICALCTSAT